MGNSRALQKATKELTKAKAPSKQRDIIYDPMGQWKHPGENTRIPGSNITMQGVPYPVYAQPNVGAPQMMYPGQEYAFPGADYVDEYPQMKRGGLKKGKYSKSLMAINKLFAKHDLFKKPGKHKIYDPNAKEYAEGGITEDMLGVINPEDLDPETLKKYLKQLKTLENSVKSGYRKGKWYPHESFEGGTDTIAYGHKLTAGEDYSKGITEAEASELQKQDVLEKQKVAENFVDNKYGKGTFDNLPQDSQMLLVDYTYNGVINKFPSFVKHVVNSNKEGMLKEYERGSKGSPLKARNEWTEDVIQDMDFKKSKKAAKKKSKESSTFSYFPVIQKMTPFEYGGSLQEAEYGMPLGAGISQNYEGRTKYKHKVGGIPELPLRDNRVNYNAYVNGFEPMTKKQYGGEDEDYIETELTDDEIQAYRDGGYIVEDISIPSLNQKQRGGGLFNRKNKEESKPLEYRAPVKIEDDLVESVTPFPEAPEDFKKGVANLKEVEVAPAWIGYSREYTGKHSKQDFIDRKKRQYLKNTNRGLSKAAGLSMENFPKDVEKNFLNEYNYKKNNHIVKSMIKDAGLSPNKREDWVGLLSDSERHLVKNSKYGDKLQPSIWSRTLAGLGTIASKFSPEINDAMNRGDLPGLTRDEQIAIKDANIKGIPIGGLETMAIEELPGVALANVVEQAGNTSFGGNYKDKPSVLSGETMGKVTSDQVAVMNPLSYTIAYDTAPLLTNAAKKTAKLTSKTVNTGKKISKQISNLKPKPGLTKLKTSTSRYEKGGESKYVDTELTDAEIQDLIDEGYIVELL